jgi:hypothetical protein
MYLTSEHFIFLELHMTIDLKSSGDEVIVAINLLSDAIAKEATQVRVGFKFGTFMWRKSDKTNTTKDMK